MQEICVRQAGEEDLPRWDAYVQNHGQFYHRAGWGQAVREVYGHDPVFLMAEQGGEITGILPLIDRRSRLFGRALISVGFTVGGGVVANDASSRQALLVEALKQGDARASDYVELRSEADQEPGWHEKTGVYDTFSVPIMENIDERLKSIRRKKRADIRKAIKWANDGKLSVQLSDDYD
ncbi:MAG: peptidoglycan bridge formation protein FemAB, partial [Pseudomonadota bacterium]